MLTVFLLLIYYLEMNQGSPLEITSAGGNDTSDLFIGSMIGVDINTCEAIAFQLRSCHSARIRLGDGTPHGSYEVLIGGWSNTKCAYRDCATCYSAEQVFDTPGVLGCDSFRDFWVSWKNDRIALGEGRQQNQRVIFDVHHTDIHDVHTISFIGFSTYPSTFLFGEFGKSRFGRLMADGKYADGELLEETLTWVTCNQRCHEHPTCGMFSYNEGLGRCALFDRITSSYTVTSEIGWKSWRMKYCQ